MTSPTHSPTPPTVAMPPATTAAPVGFRDRSLRLRVLGVLSIVLGALALSLALLTLVVGLVGFLMPGAMGGSAQDTRSIVLGAYTYVVLGVVLIAGGIGSVRLRRWARPIMLIVAWTWLLCGLVSLAFYLAMQGNMRTMLQAQLQAQPHPPPPAFVAVMMTVMLLFMVVVCVALPAIFVWGYQGKDAQRTCDAAHAGAGSCWTDRCPLPVLGLSVGLGVGAAFTVPMFLYNIVPFFGVLLTGWRAALLLLLTVVLLLVLTRQTYRLTPLGWWGTTLLLIVAPLSAVVTFARLPVIEVYRAMGLPPEQLDLIEQYRMLDSALLNVMLVLVSLACVGYMLYLRRFFAVQEAEGHG